MIENFMLRPVVNSIHTLFGGSTWAFAGMKVTIPSPNKAKQRPDLDQDAQANLGELKSDHVITVIYETSQEDLQSPAKLYYASDMARRFFNFNGNEEIKDSTATDLINQLGDLLENREEFLEDQIRVSDEMQCGRPAVARVPMRISQDHPDGNFAGYTYHPIIAHWSTEDQGEERQTNYATVIYLDVSVIPEAEDQAGVNDAAVAPDDPQGKLQLVGT